MTAANPKDRITAKEALQHPWILRTHNNDKNDDDELDLSARINDSNNTGTSLLATNITSSSSPTSEFPGQGACTIS